ncbi:MAG: pilus assembly protein [Eggerthellaceae bacterium]|nr:pilus assembly protein [Eggerthellaceae bacterium]
MRSRTESTGCRSKVPLRKDQGQATVEFALVLLAFLAVVAGLGALADFGRSGALSNHAAYGASHHVGGETGAWADVLAY